MSLLQEDSALSPSQVPNVTMHTLGGLPDEILSMIFGQVDGLESRRSLSLTCRRFNQINVPILNRDIVHKTQHPLMSKILRHFLQNKDCRAHVKSLALPSNDDTTHLDEDVMNMLREEDFGGTYDATNAFNEDEASYFLIAMLPNLEEFSTICLYQNTPWLDAAVPRGMEDEAPFLPPYPNAFGKLTKLSIAHWDTEMGLAYETMVRCLSIPTLVDFTVDKVTSGDIRTTVQPAAKLRVLNLIDANLDSVCLVDILRYGKGSLESFTFSLGGAIIGYDDLNLSALGDALWNCGSTLRNCDLQYGTGCNEEEVYGAITRLPPFLRRLRCPLDWVSTRIDSLIAGDARIWQAHSNYQPSSLSYPWISSPISILPESVEELELIVDSQPISRLHSRKVIETYMAQLIEAKLDSTLPNLQCVKLADLNINWYPEELKNSDVEPEIRSKTGEGYVMGGPRKYFNGQPCPVGTRPDDPSWVTREGWILKKLYEDAQRAGIKLSVNTPEYFWNASYIVPVVEDSDPFRLLD